MPKLYRDFDTQAQIDAQYNPSIALADASAPGKHFVAQATKARATLKNHLDIPFGPTVHETLDIFPADTPNAPVFVFIHGGYWRAMSSKDFSGVALGLQPLGITTVVVNYALCPVVTIAEITRQCRAAVAWTLRNIAQYGGDPARVAVGGHSAGGHLSAMCLETAWDTDYGLPRDPLKAAVLISGLHDLQPLRYSYLQPMIQLDEHTVRHYSPAANVRTCPTPTWVTWGGAESSEFARQSALYHAAAQALGNPTELRAVPGADHFTIVHELERSDSPMAQWLHQHLQA
ncbi:alpha/beta hydrolase [Rhodoferax saidenbachensis]|uniref:Arylformamidase n=1 Tax=Rhodoferax saidenbachensis TaxID=1484693 RepID=A0ABU1ZL77_9BURK|nr:alpha/beta hydrolase [Rhodoferax saidenbachensis]MDR7306138.1 arylformamidase [Rhodoferax saidenbachensis]